MLGVNIGESLLGIMEDRAGGKSKSVDELLGLLALLGLGSR